MPQLKFFKIIIYFCVLSILGGCAAPPAPSRKLSDAEKKLIEICKNEYKFDVVLKSLDNTVWIYLPKTESFLDLKANEKGAQSSSEPKESVSIKFLDGNFTDRTFKLEYDIGPVKTYAKDYGFSTQFNEQYQKDQRNILTAVYRAFSDLRVSDPNAPTDVKAPNFFIIVIADITKGIEARIIFYFKDLLRGMSDPLFQEEYTKRFISDYPSGNQAIIGDKEGTHLNVEELTWPNFLIKQILYRIQYKYQRSAFPPSAETEMEVLKVIKETLEAYQFEDFNTVELRDLGNTSLKRVEKSQLKEISFPEETPSMQFQLSVPSI